VNLKRISISEFSYFRKPMWVVWMKKPWTGRWQRGSTPIPGKKGASKWARNAAKLYYGAHEWEFQLLKEGKTPREN
jgi:hypothetical protein